MLVLTRRVGEEIRIGKDIRVVLVHTEDGRARLAIHAPKDMHIVRGELLQNDACQDTTERKD